MAPKVVCWRRMYDPPGHDLLRVAGAEVWVVDTADAQEVAAAQKGAQALWVRTPKRVTSDFLNADDASGVPVQHGTETAFEVVPQIEAFDGVT